MQDQARFEKAVQADNPGQALRRLALELSSEGNSQRAIYDLFETFRSRLREADREPDEDVVMDVMDALVGWCHPDTRVFPKELEDKTK